MIWHIQRIRLVMVSETEKSELLLADTDNNSIEFDLLDQ